MSGCRTQPVRVVNDCLSPVNTKLCEYHLSGIVGCRNGISVTKYPYMQDGVLTPSLDVYSDGLDATDWVEGICDTGTKYDYEKEVLCEIATGRKVILESRTDISDPTQTTITRQSYIDGTLFTGDVDTELEKCSDTDIESDAEPMCDNGITFFRWYIKTNGVSTDFFDRDIDNNVYTPTGTPTPGACAVSPTYIERLDMVDFIDPTNAIHFTRVVEWNNGVATSTYDIDNIGAPYTTTGVALSKEKDQEYKSTCYRAIVNGAGFSIGDVLEFNVVFDPRNPRSPHYINRTNRSTLGNVFEQSASGVTGAFPNVGTDIVTCEQYSEKQEHPGGVMVSNGNTFTFPSNVVSFTVTAQSGSFDISFDGGATYAMTGRKGSRTWGQGTIETIDVSQVVILSNGDIDIIWETL